MTTSLIISVAVLSAIVIWFFLEDTIKEKFDYHYTRYKINKYKVLFVVFKVSEVFFDEDLIKKQVIKIHNDYQKKYNVSLIATFDIASTQDDFIKQVVSVKVSLELIDMELNNQKYEV